MIKFSYNHSYHYSIGMTPFECAYDFNPLIPLALTPLSQDVIVSLDAKKRAEAMKNIYEKERHQLEKINDKAATINNKGRNRMMFEPSGWVWILLRKERFPQKRNKKLLPRGEVPYQVLQRTNNNAYKIDIPNDILVHDAFNVSDLSPCVVGHDGVNSRTNIS